MIRKVSAEDIATRGNGTGLEYMCPTWHFVYIFFNPVFQVSTAKNEINLFNNHILIVAPVTFAPAGAMTPSAEFLLVESFLSCKLYAKPFVYTKSDYIICTFTSSDNFQLWTLFTISVNINPCSAEPGYTLRLQTV